MLSYVLNPFFWWGAKHGVFFNLLSINEFRKKMRSASDMSASQMSIPLMPNPQTANRLSPMPNSAQLILCEALEYMVLLYLYAWWSICATSPTNGHSRPLSKTDFLFVRLHRCLSCLRFMWIWLKWPIILTFANNGAIELKSLCNFCKKR